MNQIAAKTSSRKGAEKLQKAQNQRRIGAMGAYAISIDLEKQQFVPASEWIPVD